MKKPFVTKSQLDKITQTYPTPFHLYDERGIRANARRLYQAFSWNPGFKEYFAVKATPNPTILKILREEGCGADCSSLVELMLAERCGFRGREIMFSSNNTLAEEYQLADRLGAFINLDDLTHVEFLEESIGHIPKTVFCRYNPGGVFTLGESRDGAQVMDNPGEAKYGMTRPQIAEAFRRLAAKGAREFGIHAFLASNTLSNDYYPALARILFQLAVDLQQEQYAVLLENLPLLEEFGFEAEDFGTGCLMVRAIPSDIDAGLIRETLEMLADKLLTGGGADPASARDAMLHTMACKAAIKGGWKSDPAELRALIDKVQSGEVQYCPHGRPVKVKLSKYEIEKMFKRA